MLILLCINKIYDDALGYDVYQKTVIYGVHFEHSLNTNVIKSGLENADSGFVVIPFNCVMSRRYIEPFRFRKLDDKSMYFTFEKGDRIVKGILDFEINSEKSLDENYDAYTITKVDVMDYGSPNMRHFELGVR